MELEDDYVHFVAISLFFFMPNFMHIIIIFIIVVIYFSPHCY